MKIPIFLTLLSFCLALSTASAQNNIKDDQLAPYTGTLTGEQLLQKIKDTYLALTTFKAKVQVITQAENDLVGFSSHTDIDMSMMKPNYYIINWQALSARWQTAGVVWDDGSKSYLYEYNYNAYQIMTIDHQRALYDASANLGGPPITVPSLFLQGFKQELHVFVHPKIIGMQAINGEVCYVLDEYSGHERLWVSASRFLIMVYREYFILGPPNTLSGLAKINPKMLSSHGYTAQIFTDISMPPLKPEDFRFKLPAGARQKVYDSEAGSNLKITGGRS